MISTICDLGLAPMIFINTVPMTRELAEFPYRNGAPVMGRLDSLRAEVQDFLSGLPATYNRIQRGVHPLLQAGLARPKDLPTLSFSSAETFRCLKPQIHKNIL